MLDLLIINGHVIDPLAGTDGTAPVGIQGGKTVGLPAGAPLPEAAHTVDAAGLYVLPGLVDFHIHAYGSGSGMSIPSADVLLPFGVTAAVDSGTAGCLNYEGFHRDMVNACLVRLKSYLNVYGPGQLDDGMPEDFDPAVIDAGRIGRMLERYPGEILGLKIRMDGVTARNASLASLQKTKAIADGYNVGVCVHTSNMPCSPEELSGVLTAGDIYCHMYHGRGPTILDSDGKVRDCIWQARKRGVLFDSANGGSNFSFSTAKAALAQGFAPDIISTDMTRTKLNKGCQVRSLPFLMSKYLSMGMPLFDIVRAVTQTPAAAMGISGKTGTLQPGAFADVALFSLIDRECLYQDSTGEEYRGGKLLVPHMTVIGGDIAFRREEFFVV